MPASGSPLAVTRRLEAQLQPLDVGPRRVAGLPGGRRKADRVQSIDRFAVGDALALFVEIGPVAPHALARETRLRVTAVAQARALEAELQRTLSWDWASREYVAIMETVCGHLRELKQLLDPTGRLYREV